MKNNRNKHIKLIASILLLCVIESSYSQLKIHSYFSDNAIIQRNKPIVIPGHCKPNSVVFAKINNSETKTVANALGQFELHLPAQNFGGPFQLLVKSVNDTITIKNILIGDVWLASGQSNMEWSLEKSSDSEIEIERANNVNIRFFEVEKNKEFYPIDSIKLSSKWIVGNSKAIKNVSGVAYFFAKKIASKTGIPIGIIHSSWGGTRIETWMSKSSLQKLPFASEEIKELEKQNQSLQNLEKNSLKQFNEWYKNYYFLGNGIKEKWYLPNTKTDDWKNITVPSFWEKEFPELKDFNGVAWIRKKFDVPKSFLNKDIRVYLSQIDDHNMCWVNGHFIGETLFKDSWTNYQIPKNILKEKNNEIVLRIVDVGNKGGTTGYPNYFDLYPEGNKSNKQNISGVWKFKTDFRYKDSIYIPLKKDYVSPNKYVSLLYNAMIHPFKQIPITGVIWYQGESNTSNSEEYEELFPGLINDWRSLWDDKNLPFYFVQIANYGDVKEIPSESDTAQLREAQNLTQTLPNTGMVCTIDIGDPSDIHPTNKKEVGFRLARHALKNQYNFKNITTDGPQYNCHQLKKNKVILKFLNDNGLHTIDGKKPMAFEIAGKDDVFYWADATLVTKNNESKIILESKRVPNPIKVRYAWADSPKVNLVNSDGLPMYPFKTEPSKKCSKK